jgi:hypothetical protein
MGNEERNNPYQQRTAYGSDTVTTDWIITNYERIQYISFEERIYYLHPLPSVRK